MSHIRLPEGNDYRVDLPLGHPRARHPQDSSISDAELVWGRSSAGQHMALTRRGFPSQQGAHFDNPYHFKNDGSQEATGPTDGPARVADLRGFLVSESDGHAITKGVIEAWLSAARRAFTRNDASWRIVGLRTLTHAEAAQESPLERFPFWEDPEAVQAFLDGIRDATDVEVQAVLNEPPSVDRVDQGHLLIPDPETGRGGAHGAFFERGVAIGEFFDFSRLDAGDHHGQFKAVRGLPFPDSTPIVVAWFIPHEPCHE